MVIDAGIDWNARYGAGWIARFSASPAFEASAALLYGAAQLWRGRYGQGRQIGTHAASLASVMNDLGSEWRRAALRRIPDVFPEGVLDSDASSLLARHSGRTGYYLDRDTKIEKSPMAARRLVRAAIVSAESHLETIRITGREIGDYGKDAETWENRFETVGETALGEPPEGDVSDDAYAALSRYAAYRTCHALWSVVGGIHLYANGNISLPVDRDPSIRKYYGEAERFEALEKAAHEDFACRLSSDDAERAAIRSVRDHSSPADNHHDHYASRETLDGTVLIVSLYTKILLQRVDRPGDQADWSTALIDDRMSLKSLPSPAKTKGGRNT